ncbi:DUF2199 domain-containing protein [Chryseobacterium sp. BIGb0232]|uniref:DUF2199 domain-containing protein n=1 Tax=Chryseobacterium sp. BIGb0232 TaxID=2940598 RepID=UPI000F49D8F0|nr:DUF2199 domain-containing protein [Chryseobacterium sp. BIGb0232]MCS4301258.1 hypothetical protein [Chryseobacterium sp. BIGb0232]ROS19882.1 hypothetical protein EDF65_0580 [Chryseobacterium nakagawai]
MKYICECCGEEKEDWPALAYNAPYFYYCLSDEEMKNAKLTRDLCTVESTEETNRFIRAVLIQEVTDDCRDLDYGVWVSLSEKSYIEYVENYDNKEFKAEYFGWLNTYLPDYDFSESIPTTVVVDNTIGRPFVFPHQSYEHPFVDDFYNGITKDEAEKRINRVLNPE